MTNRRVADSRRAADAYRAAGVDVAAADKFIDRIKPLAAATATSNVLAGIGGFGALVQVPPSLREPTLVCGADGVGTKILLARQAGKLDGIGIDLVAMCINDIITHGAQPLFFADYYACAKLNPRQGEAVVKGIAKGCQIAGCALVGGETAEMPGMYQPDDFDLAGFAVGVVEKADIIAPARVCAGDAVIALASTGAHSNGYTLIRKILQDNDIALDSPLRRHLPFSSPQRPPFTSPQRLPFTSPPLAGGTEGGLNMESDSKSADSPPLADNNSPNYSPNKTVADAMLRPTRIYAPAIAAILAAEKDAIHGIAHITGGGIPGNLPRVLPPGMQALIDKTAWQRPPLFNFLAKAGGLSEEEMLKTFNCGIGMIIIAAAKRAEAIINIARNKGEIPFIIGEITAANLAANSAANPAASNAAASNAATSADSAAAPEVIFRN